MLYSTAAISMNLGVVPRLLVLDGGGPYDRQTAISLPWPTSGAREDDELLSGPGHRDIAVDRSLDADPERLCA